MRYIWSFLLILATHTAIAQDSRLVFDVVDITGEVQKPEITIFITRQNLDTDYELVLRESFVDKIVESVDEKPF